MKSVISVARGSIYFNSVMGAGPCLSSSVLRSSQLVPNFCGIRQMDALKEINKRIHSLAPVINTQSYQWNFGPKLDTMLKVKDGFAYIFSMINGVATSFAGERKFTLPPGITGSFVEVLNEGRSIPVFN